MTSKAILTDTTLCTGCEQCVEACKKVKGLGKDHPRKWKRSGIDDLSATRFTTVVRPTDNLFVRRQCLHCLEPACVSACIVGALQKSKEGAVLYDSKKCIGCRYCMLACPFAIPRFDWGKTISLIRKCDLCHPRLKEGKQPACTEICPEGATIFGTREELLAEAHRRIAANPERYVNKVFGEKEVGGTSVLYISDTSLANTLMWDPGIGEQKLPELTWQAMKKVPPTICVVGGAMAGIWWVIGRRMKMQALAQAESGESDIQSQDSSSDEATGEKLS